MLFWLTFFGSGKSSTHCQLKTAKKISIFTMSCMLWHDSLVGPPSWSSSVRKVVFHRPGTHAKPFWGLEQKSLNAALAMTRHWKESQSHYINPNTYNKS